MGDSLNPHIETYVAQLLSTKFDKSYNQCLQSVRQQPEEAIVIYALETNPKLLLYSNNLLQRGGEAIR